MAIVESRVRPDLPESRSYRLKRRLLGKPLVTERLSQERLTKPIALGVLSPDCISSTAYGTEEMLTILVPYVGLAAFDLVLPVTYAILGILFLVTMSYREVVMVYTKAGGSYAVARDNFGVNVAQIAAVALLIDYVVTVAVQASAGTDALTSAVPTLRNETSQVVITVGIVLILLYGNLRGLREAGRVFAVPTYLFIVSTGSVIIVGLIKEAVTGLPKANVHAPGALSLGTHSGSGFLMGATVFVMLKALANGGSSLTGLEAISNGVSSFRPAEGPNARRVLVIMSTILGSLVLGVSILAHLTHAIPYKVGSPTVLAQEAELVFGTTGFGHLVYLAVVFCTVLILWTGANTSFNGFPFLASFVAEDRFLPAKLTKRGHRLVFSNGIIVLAAISLALIVVTRANVSKLVAVYAIGVFTGFTMAGAGMVKHHLVHREPHWRRKIVINGSAAFVSFGVVLIFVWTKFTEGAWVVVVLFPVLVFTLIRLNQRYQEEASVLGEAAAEATADARPLPRHVALVFVDRLDLATSRAIQYARALSVDDVRAVHFAIDTARAQALEDRWVRYGMGRLPLELVECPDRRVVRAAVEMAYEAASDGQTEVSVLLPRRSYTYGWNRLLHDSVGEQIAAAVSRLEHVNATIVPFDVDGELRDLRRGGRRMLTVTSTEGETEEQRLDEHLLPDGARGTPIASLQPRQRARVVGRVKSLTVQPWGNVPTLQVQLTDDQAKLEVAFLGRRQIAGLVPGSRIVVDGTVTQRRGQLVMINPEYEFVAAPEHST
jgi:amino acid transporter